MKEFYVYDSEFRELKRTGAIAAILFAIGSALLGFAVNAHLGVTFAESLPVATKTQWVTYRNVAAVVALCCYVFAAIQALSGYNQVEQIKAQTSHGTERYQPKPWYRYAMAAIILAMALVMGALLGRVFW